MISEVLAPVPAYTEYKAMQEQLNKEGVWYTEISYKKLEKEKQQTPRLAEGVQTLSFLFY